MLEQRGCQQTRSDDIGSDDMLEDDEDEEEDEDFEKGSKMEDVRTSNFAYSQTKIGDILTLVFVLIGIYSGVVSSEMGVTPE